MSDENKNKVGQELSATSQELTKSEVATREEAVLAFWNEHQIFKQSLEKEAPQGDFVFYDGPPFATGLPHYGHILASTIKDAVPRFWTMNGYRVRRQWGWDCHGLPLENLIEKRLGLATKRDIEEYGVKNFNEQAREAVLEYADDWKVIIPRMGRFADMDDDYKTMDPTYTESVWWVFKTLHDKGLVYEGFKSMHLCPRCGTTLSNFEVNLGYKDIKDIAVTVKLPLLDEAGAPTDTSLLVWTTTPWTLPGNLAAAVNEEYDYVTVKVNGEAGAEKVTLAKGRLAQLGTDDYEIIDEMKGAALVGRRYEPPFPFLKDQEMAGKDNAWKIYHAPYVELGQEGTGAVHLAPAYGEEDMELAKEHKIPIFHHVDGEGRFKAFVAGLADQLVKPKDDDEANITHLDADIEIVRRLKDAGKLFKKENITHSYPHCWRCDTPLLNYATTSWFVEVTKFKDELVAANQQVHWVPEHVGQNRFGNWLEGARDWAVSRQRYWGAPLPVWRNPETKEIKVFGSLADLQAHVPKSGNRYFMMRHGEADSNVKNIISADVAAVDGLTERGRQQVLEAAKELSGQIDLIIHSGYQRTRESAELLAETMGLGIESLISDARLGEVQAGVEFEGKTWDEYNQQYGAWGGRYVNQFEGQENRRDVQRRAAELLFQLEQQYQDKRILLVGHGGTLFAVECAAAAATPAAAKLIRDKRGYLDNAEVREISFTPYPHNDHFELDYHRPYIDDIKLYDGDVELKRVPDVFDCWFESGSMPYGQHHYPFEHAAEFERELFPAQFIAEGLDQTRGWFYSLIVLGTALFGKSPYENVIVNGLVLAEDGKKMSKSLQNYPDPMDVADRVGVDAIRFYMLQAPIMRGEDLNFSEKEVQELQRKNLGRLHNVLAMYETYADGTEANAASTQVLDRWILARLQELINETTAGFKAYELDRATRPITDFIDDLSVWYLRRSRDRLKQNSSVESSALLQGPDASVTVSPNTSPSSSSSRLAPETQPTNPVDPVADKQAALGTLRFVLQQLALVMAPSMPFYADYLWGRVRHESDPISVHLADWPKYDEPDRELLQEMELTRSVVSQALELRAKANIKVRQPLARLFVKHELRAEAEPFVQLIKDEVNVKSVVSDLGLAAPVALDTEITPELKVEGGVRELIRHIQDQRKALGLLPQDSITLIIQTSDGGEAAVRQFHDEIAKTVGAAVIEFGDAEGAEILAGEHSFTISLQKLA